MAVLFLRIWDSLPYTRTGGHIAYQLLRSGTSPAPNYAEARGAESDKDFIHKLGIVLKELNESHVWLNIIERSAMLPQEDLTDLKQECTTMCRIIAASINTVKKRCGT